MSRPKRIVVVDDDAKVRQLLQYRLSPPEFEFFGFSDGRDALMKLHDIGPDLIVSDIRMPDMDGRVFFQVVKRSPVLKHVPFIFVSAVRANEDLMAALDAGADAFFVKPFPISQLIARIRTDLGLSDGESAAVTGSLGLGVTPLSGSESRRLEAPPPPPHGTEPTPQVGSNELFDLLLAAPAPGEPRPATITEPSFAGGAGRAFSEERSSVVDVRGKRLHIRTEVRSLPTFAVVTGVMRGERAIARIETAWQHPLGRIEDRALVRRQIDLQHHQAVGMVEELVVETTPRQVLWGDKERSVDASILCRAMSSICAQLRAHVAAPALIGFLRLSHATTCQARPGLRCFCIRPDGSVWCDRSSERLPHDAVTSVAAWASELLTETARSSERAPELRIRQLTRPMADELERLGFYSAFDGLAGSHGTPGRSTSAGTRPGPRPVGGPGPGANLSSGRSED